MKIILPLGIISKGLFLPLADFKCIYETCVNEVMLFQFFTMMKHVSIIVICTMSLSITSLFTLPVSFWIVTILNMYIIYSSDKTCQIALNHDNVVTHVITNEYEKYLKKQGYSKLGWQVHT